MQADQRAFISLKHPVGLDQCQADAIETTEARDGAAARDP
jgi:hypothetical protein